MGSGRIESDGERVEGCSNKLISWGRRKRTKFIEEIRECGRKVGGT
jgi:hypothetical protein